MGDVRNINKINRSEDEDFNTPCCDKISRQLYKSKRQIVPTQKKWKKDEIINSEKELIMNKKNRQYWSKKVEDFKRSGKTKEEWCQKKDVSLRQFSYWLRQFSEETTETQWLPVEIKPDNKNLSVPPLNIKIGAASIEVYPGYDKEFLLETLRTLQSL